MNGLDDCRLLFGLGSSTFRYSDSLSELDSESSNSTLLTEICNGNEKENK